MPDVYHADPAINSIMCRFDPKDRALFERATYFVLETSVEYGDHYLLASIKNAEKKGEFILNIGLPDRPDDRRAETFDTFVQGMARLAELKRSHPHARQWLSTLQVQAEIEGDSVWEGVVNALAEADDDEFNPWLQLRGMVARARSYGVPLRPFAENWLPGLGRLRPTIESVIDHL